MKKYFASFLAAGTVASFAAACGKKAKAKAHTAFSNVEFNVTTTEFRK